MLRIASHLFFLIAVLLPLSVQAQMEENPMDSSNYVDESFFSVKPGGVLEYYTPMKYGATAQLFIGIRRNKGYRGIPHQEDRDYNGLALGFGLYRGGYHFGLYYYDLSAWVGPVGKKIGLVYLNTNNYSSVVKRSELIGLQADFLLGIMNFKLGAMKEMNSKQVIPTLGFGIPIGPGLWYDD